MKMKLNLIFCVHITQNYDRKLVAFKRYFVVDEYKYDFFLQNTPV